MNTYGDLYADWDTAKHTEAQQIVVSITSFIIITGFLTVYQYLSHLAGIKAKLQQEAYDIVEAHQLIAAVTTTYKEEQTNVDSGFSAIYAQSEQMADAVGTSVDMP